MEQDLLIQGDPELLAWISERIEDELGPDARLEPMTSSDAGEFREPILIGLIIALGGPQVIRSIVSIIDRALEHRERMRALEIADRDAERDDRLAALRLAYLGDDDSETAVSLDTLRAEVAR